jgi:ABC-type dipeptide/oligopeptide/nickel transport system permease component
MNTLMFLVRRLAASLLVLFGLSLMTFLLARVIPSNAAALYIGPRARPADIERVSQQLGLDQPLPVQYAHYLGGVLRGDWGDSIGSKRPVLQEILERLPATLELLSVAMLLALLLGVPLGVLSAQWQGRRPDLLVRVLAIIGVSLPAFWLGLLLQIVFFRWLNILPLAGQLDADLRFTHPLASITGFVLLDAFLSGNWVALRDAAWHLVLPAFTLAAYPIGLIARMTRATMLEILAQDYIRTARAYGLSERAVIYVHALKNAIGPTLTVFGLTVAYALTGSFFVEVIFNWPGLGQFAVRALLNVDYPAIMGITLFGALGYVLINLATDLLHAWIDPRIRLG